MCVCVIQTKAPDTAISIDTVYQDAYDERDPVYRPFTVRPAHSVRTHDQLHPTAAARDPLDKDAISCSPTLLPFAGQTIPNGLRQFEINFDNRFEVINFKLINLSLL